MTWNNDNNIYKSYISSTNNDVKNFSFICSVCGRKDLHIFFHRWRKNDLKGSGWIWFSYCKSFDHGRFTLPNHWENFEKINPENLKYEPNYLEEIKNCIDEYIYKFKSDN